MNIKDKISSLLVILKKHDISNAKTLLGEYNKVRAYKKFISSLILPFVFICFALVAILVDGDYYKNTSLNGDTNIDNSLRLEKEIPPMNGFFIYKYEADKTIYNKKTQKQIKLGSQPQLPDKFDTLNSYVMLKMNNSYINDNIRKFYELDDIVENNTEKTNIINKIFQEYGNFNPYSVTLVLGPNTIGELLDKGIRIEKGTAYICSNSTIINVRDDYGEVLFNTDAENEFATSITNKCFLIKSEQGFFNVYPINNPSDMYNDGMKQYQASELNNSKFVYVNYIVSSNLSELTQSKGLDDKFGNLSFTFLGGSLTINSNISPSVLLLKKETLVSLNFITILKDLNIIPSTSFIHENNSNLISLSDIGSVIPYSDEVVITYNNELVELKMSGSYNGLISQDKKSVIVKMPIILENTKVSYTVTDKFGNSKTDTITIGKKEFSIAINLKKSIQSLNWTLTDSDGVVKSFRVFKNGNIYKEVDKGTNSIEIKKEDVGSRFVVCGFNQNAGCVGQSNEVVIELVDVIQPKANFKVEQLSFNRVKVQWLPTDLNGQYIQGYEIGYSYKNTDAFCGKPDVQCKNYDKGFNSDIIEHLEYDKEYTFTISMYINGGNDNAVIREKVKITIQHN